MIGHQHARAYLERSLPAATLLYGPPSVGKWTMALHLADHHHVHNLDRWVVDHDLSIETVRLITHFAARSPQGPYKLIIARLDDASRPALNAMLKTLEEPPPHVRFLLTASHKPATTILSRCVPFELGALSEAELRQVYVTQGYSAPRADNAARFARGSVQQGYGFETARDHHHHVSTMIRALQGGDRESFVVAFTAWDAHHSELLRTLLTECVTRRWTTFTEPDGHGLHHDRRRLWRIVAAVMKFRSARPRLGVRAALEPFLKP